MFYLVECYKNCSTEIINIKQEAWKPAITRKKDDTSDPLDTIVTINKYFVL